MSKLRECSEEATVAVNALVEKYDIRLVLAALGARFGEAAAAAMAAGVKRDYVLEILVGTLDCAFTPPKKPPVVEYVDGDQVLGRKQ